MSGKFRIVEHLEEKNCGVEGKPSCCENETGITQCVAGVTTNCMTLSAKPASVTTGQLISGLSTATSGVTATLNSLKCVCPPGKSPSVKTIKHSRGQWSSANGSLECK